MAIDKNEPVKIKIDKTYGITHALKKLIENIPNSVLSEDSISSAEWDATMDKLIEINNKRKQEGKESIFTGGTDKSKTGWKTSFIVHKDQEIEFTADEIQEIYNAMGVSFNNEDPNSSSNQKGYINNKGEIINDSTRNQAELELKSDSVLNTLPDSASIRQVMPPDSTSQNTDSIAVSQKTNIPKSALTAEMPIEKKKDNEKPKETTRLSWSEIGNIAWKSTKKFVKGMFCDEEGKFSLGRTAVTVGVIAACAIAAPVVATGAATILTGLGVAATTATVIANAAVATVMLTPIIHDAGKKAFEGGINYYTAETKEDAVTAMEQGWDGAVELASIPVMGKLFKWGSDKLSAILPKTKIMGENKLLNQTKATENTNPQGVNPQGVNSQGVNPQGGAQNSNQSTNSQVNNNKGAKKHSRAEQKQRNQKAKNLREQRRANEKKRLEEETRKAEEARKAEELRKAEEAEQARQAEEAKKAQEAEAQRIKEEKLAEAQARQVEVTEETLPQLQDALKAELKDEALVKHVMDDIIAYLSMKDYPIPQDSFVQFIDMSNNKAAIDIGGKLYILKQGINPNITMPKPTVAKPNTTENPSTPEITPEVINQGANQGIKPQIENQGANRSGNLESASESVSAEVSPVAQPLAGSKPNTSSKGSKKRNFIEQFNRDLQAYIKKFKRKPKIVKLDSENYQEIYTNSTQKAKLIVYKDSKGNVFLTEKFKYNENGKKIKKTREENSGRIVTTEFEYNAQGNVTKEITTNPLYQDVREYIYDKSGTKLIEEIYRSSIYEKTYRYNKDGKIIFEVEKQNGLATESKEFTYNSKNLKSKEIIRDGNGNTKETVTYDYNEKGQIINELHTKQTTVIKIEFNYKKGKKVSEYRYEYDSEGKIIKAEEYDTKGNFVKKLDDKQIKNPNNNEDIRNAKLEKYKADQKAFEDSFTPYNGSETVLPNTGVNPSEIGIGLYEGGFNNFSQGKNLIFDMREAIDPRRFLIQKFYGSNTNSPINSHEPACFYSEANNVTSIVYQGAGGGIGWGCGNFVIKGKISQADAKNLIEFLIKKELFTRSLNGEIRVKNGVSSSSEKVFREAIAEFFNTKGTSTPKAETVAKQTTTTKIDPAKQARNKEIMERFEDYDLKSAGEITNIKNLKTEEVGIVENYDGYWGDITKNSIFKSSPLDHRVPYDREVRILYNAKEDFSMIHINGLDSSNRGGGYLSILIKGKVSQSDGLQLAKELFDKWLIVDINTTPTNDLGTSTRLARAKAGSRENDPSIVEKVQQYVVDYFNKK